MRGSRGPAIRVKIDIGRIARLLANPDVPVKTTMARFHISQERARKIMEEHGITRRQKGRPK